MPLNLKDVDTLSCEILVIDFVFNVYVNAATKMASSHYRCGDSNVWVY